jgi:hypothetical protein
MQPILIFWLLCNIYQAFAIPALDSDLVQHSFNSGDAELIDFLDPRINGGRMLDVSLSLLLASPAG